MSKSELPSGIADLVLGASQVRMPFSDALAQSDVIQKLSTGLRKCPPGSVVLLDIEDMAIYVRALLECLALDLIPAVVDPRLPDRLRLNYLSSIYASLVIFQRGTEAPSMKTMCNVEIPYDTADVGIIQMTSGTTGSPVVIKRYVSHIEAEIRRFLDLPHFQETIDTLVMTASPFHTFCLYGAVLPGIMTGRDLVWKRGYGREDRESDWRDRPQKSALLSVPTFLEIALDNQDSLPVSDFGAVIVAGERLNEVRADKLFASNPRTLNNFGTTETGMLAVSGNYDLNSLVPISNEDVRITDNSLEARLPKDPYLEGRVGVFKDGWLRTGDVVEGGSDQSFRIVGRSDSRVSVHGIKVSLSHIEDCAMLLDGVNRAVAFMHDSIFLYLECEEKIDVSTLRGGLRQSLSPVEMPRNIRILPELPRTPLGKVSRNPREYERMRGEG